MVKVSRTAAMTAEEAMAAEETTPLLISEPADKPRAVPPFDAAEPPLTPASEAAAWAATVSTPSGGHLLDDSFPGNDTLPGDITPVDEPVLDDDGTCEPTRGARLKLVKVHPPQRVNVLDLREEEEDDDEEEREQEQAGGRLTRSTSQVTFSDEVESRGPPSAWKPSPQSVQDKYALGGADAAPGAEGCGSPRKRVAGVVKKPDPRAPRLLTGGTLDSLPGGRDDDDAQSVCCVIS